MRQLCYSKRVSPSQSAAIPYRYDEADQLQVLLVTSRGRKRWVLPKGKVKRGLLPHASAACEAFEEAGVIGDIERVPLGLYRQSKLASKGHLLEVVVAAFPLLVTGQSKSWPEKALRKRCWMSVEDAAHAVQDSGLRGILRRFAATVKRSN